MKEIMKQNWWFYIVSSLIIYLYLYVLPRFSFVNIYFYYNTFFSLGYAISLKFIRKIYFVVIRLISVQRVNSASQPLTCLSITPVRNRDNLLPYLIRVVRHASTPAVSRCAGRLEQAQFPTQWSVALSNADRSADTTPQTSRDPSHSVGDFWPTTHAIWSSLAGVGPDSRTNCRTGLRSCFCWLSSHPVVIWIL